MALVQGTGPSLIAPDQPYPETSANRAAAAIEQSGDAKAKPVAVSLRQIDQSLNQLHKAARQPLNIDRVTIRDASGVIGYLGADPSGAGAQFGITGNGITTTLNNATDAVAGLPTGLHVQDTSTSYYAFVAPAQIGLVTSGGGQYVIIGIQAGLPGTTFFGFSDPTGTNTWNLTASNTGMSILAVVGGVSHSGGLYTGTVAGASAKNVIAGLIVN